MRFKVRASQIFILSIMLGFISCILSGIRIYSAPSRVAWEWLIFVSSLFASAGIICFGLTIIVLPHEWLERNLPFGKPFSYKLEVGIIIICVGLGIIFLGIRGLLQFLGQV